MEASMLEEVVQNPNPYPVVVKLEYPDVWKLCEQARELAWDPARDIDYADIRNADLPPEVRSAGAEWWSLRGWMEHGAIAYGAERLREAIFSHQPFEVKQHITNFIAEELRHHEASFRLADALLRAGRARESVALFRKVVASEPRSADPYVGLATALAQTGRVAEAKQALEQALAVDPRSGQARYNLGEIARLAGDTAEARRQYEAARADPVTRERAEARLQSLGQAERR